MSSARNARKCWECSSGELWAMNLRRPNLVAQDDECHRCGGNQALKAFIKSFEVPQRSVKIKIKVNIFSLSGIGTRTVNMKT